MRANQCWVGGRAGIESAGTEWILEKKLGEGGFGEVWLGRHEKLKDRRVFKFCFRADRVRSLKREVTLFRVLKDGWGIIRTLWGCKKCILTNRLFTL